MRLLIVGDSPGLFSGQARMTRELAARFAADGATVICAGWHEMIAPEFDPPGYTVIPTLKQKPEMLQPILEGERPDVVLAMGDPWNFTWLAAQRAQGAPWVLCGYLNIETEDFPGRLEVVLDGFDQARVTSEAGARVIGRPQVTPVHLGVDRGVFAPVASRPARILGRDIQGKFVILVNGQNTVRKNLGIAVRAIAEARALGSRDVLGIINAEPRSPIGYDLIAEVIRLDAQEYIAFVPQNHGPANTIPEVQVVELYRAADCLLVTSMAEGFCLPVLEAMSMRVPVVAPWAFSMPELLGEGRGVLYDPGSPIMSSSGGWVTAPNPRDAAEAMVTGVPAMTPDRMNRAEAFAAAKSWQRCYVDIAEMVGTATQTPRWPAPGAVAANGLPIDALSRTRVRALTKPKLGVIKLGGLGDMLMTTRVIAAAARRWNLPAVVLCNQYLDVFQDMPEVDTVVQIKPGPQDVMVRSVADEFEICLDLRSVSRIYGHDLARFDATHPTPHAIAWRWAYEHWTESLSRIETFGMHVTRLMLVSLGLPDDDISPVFKPREKTLPVGFHDRYLAICPGAGSLGPLKQPTRQWWSALRNQVPHAQVVQLGAAADPLIPGCLDGRGWSLPAAATVLERAEHVVCVESGLAHLARAVRGPEAKPAVVLFGPTPVIAYGYPEHVNLTRRLCQPCFWGPTWVEQRCAMGASGCLNLPDLPDVLAALK